MEKKEKRNEKGKNKRKRKKRKDKEEKSKENENNKRMERPLTLGRHKGQRMCMEEINDLAWNLKFK